MAKIGYLLSSEENSAPHLVDYAAAAEQAGFQSLRISDHFHPGNDEQGQSPFIWSTLAACCRSRQQAPDNDGGDVPHDPDPSRDHRPGGRHYRHSPAR